LGRLLNGYMNKMEEETGEPYSEWTDVLDTIRTRLNDIRRKSVSNDMFKQDYPAPTFTKDAKFKVGSIVYRRVMYPKNALMQDQDTANFREGDYRWEKVPRKVVNVLYYAGTNPYRYILEGFPNVSYAEYELMASPEQEQKWIVRDIVGKRKVRNQVQYQVWWKGYPKSEADWQTEKALREDGLADYIERYEAEQKSKPSKGKK